MSASTPLAAPLPANAPPARADTHYDICFVIDGKRFFWKNPNHGVTITDAGPGSCLTWQEDGRETQRLWTDIAAVSMNSGTDGKNEVNNCRIVFRDGRAITVTDTGTDGRLDESRTPIYRDFVRALHRRLALAPEGVIVFNAGVSEGRYLGMRIVLVIAALFFVGLPLILLLWIRDWKIIGVLGAGAMFVWPFYNVVKNNKPRHYDPRNPPPELMQ